MKILLALLMLPSLALADVYTYVDAAGNRVFTDQPRRNAQRVEIATGNRMASQTTPLPVPTPAHPTRKTKPRETYQLLRILSPEPDAAFNSTAGEIVVTLTSDPPLMSGDSYQLLLDDQVASAAGPSPVIALKNIDRGTHKLAAQIVDSRGQVLERTAYQPVHLQRISLAQKRKVRPCQADDYGARPECPLSDKPEEEDDDS